MKTPRYVPFLFIAPGFIILIIFTYYPMFSAFYHSLFNWTIVESTFVGLNNYIELFHSRVFLNSLEHMAIFVVIGTLLITIMAIIGGELVYNYRPKKLSSMWKYLFIIPMVVPFSVGMLIWIFIYLPYNGILWEFLTNIGLGNLAIPWLGLPNTALLAVIFVGFPFLSSLQFLIVLSSLQNLDVSVLESSILDGASTFYRILKIDLPMIMDKIFLIVLLTVIGGSQVAASMLILTGGGPGNSTMVPGLYIYQTAFNQSRYGYSSAAGVVLMFITLGMIFVIEGIESFINKRSA
jgi:raffinose/stachyose/melibiose transport system permease protein